MKPTKSTLLYATVGITIAIIFGAFGAHYLKTKLTPDLLESFKTGVQYQLYMCIGLLAISNLKISASKGVLTAIKCVKLGTILFAGSIYLLTLKNLSPTMSFLSIAGPITPIGGVLLIVGWFKIAFHIFKLKE